VASLYLDDLLHAQVLAFNPKYKEAEGALAVSSGGLSADIAATRKFLIFAASPARRSNETISRMLKSSGCRLLKKIQRRDAQITTMKAEI